jgi:hypothetical protein
MLNNLELNNFLFFNNNGDINEKINYIQSNSEIIKNALGDRGVKILDDLYLKNKNVLKLYWDYNLFDYIKFIKRNDLFGDKGIKKALTLMKNENFKTQFIKQQGQNLYDILLNQINS